MCAIAGMIGFTPEEDTVEKMLATMERRGPDGKGVYWGEGAVLLHSRLAIIDPEGGAQPMVWQQQGRTWILVYNGELYNTAEIRSELEHLGHRFQGHSDTEVVLHAYAQFGSACLDKFNGIFAFAVWEPKQRRLFLARDRIGVKPLFFAQQSEMLCFASEIKTLLTVPGIRPRLDLEGAAQLLLLGPGRLPGSGVFSGIRELEPGQYAVYEDGQLKAHRYWYLQDRENRDSFAETVEKVSYLVRDAIVRQTVSDVPIGTFLSGGLDSSIISSLCARQAAGRGEQLTTFSVDYANNAAYFTPGKFQPNADPEYIDKMESYLSCRGCHTVLTPEELDGVLEDATIARDLPGMADVDFSLLVFCGRIRREVKVALSGECADEIFGGYPWYRDPEVRSREGFPWAQNTNDRAALMTDALCRKIDPQGFVGDAYLDTCRSADILPGTTPEERRMKQMVNLNFRWFMQTLLDRKDRMSMHHGLEVRVPFCDYRIAEYLYTVPWEYKDYQGQEKGLLRQAVKDLLPDVVLNRKKSPYPKTFDPKYAAIMEKRLQQLLQADSPLFTMVDRKALQNYLQTDVQWPWYGQLMRRPQTIAYFVQMDFWLRHYGVELLF